MRWLPCLRIHAEGFARFKEDSIQFRFTNRDIAFQSGKEDPLWLFNRQCPELSPGGSTWESSTAPIALRLGDKPWKHVNLNAYETKWRILVWDCCEWLQSVYGFPFRPTSSCIIRSCQILSKEKKKMGGTQWWIRVLFSEAFLFNIILYFLPSQRNLKVISEDHSRDSGDLLLGLFSRVFRSNWTFILNNVYKADFDHMQNMILNRKMM